MKKVINISLDIETLSRKEDAAMISIAAIPFDKYSIDEYPDKCPKELLGKGGCASIEHYYEVINATSCALLGMNFEMETVRFWQKQEDQAKAELLGNNAVTIGYAMDGFVNYLTLIKEKYDVDIHIWAQGIDFDMPIIRNAIRTAIGANEFPWKYNQVRDARTWILENIELLHGELEDPYSVLPKYEGNGVKHSALYDAERTAFNIKHLFGELTSTIRGRNNKAIEEIIRLL